MTRIEWQTTTERKVVVEVSMDRERRIDNFSTEKCADLRIKVLLDGETVRGYLHSITPTVVHGLTIVAVYGPIGISSEQMVAIKSSPEWAENKANSAAAYKLSKKLDAAHAAREAIYHQCDDSDAC